jgi:hypothetical protein
MLRLTINRQVCLGHKPLSGVQDRIFLIVRHLRFFLCGTLSMTRGRVCRLQVLLAVANAVILGSESCGIHSHVILSQIRDTPTWRARSRIYVPKE